MTGAAASRDGSRRWHASLMALVAIVTVVAVVVHSGVFDDVSVHALRTRIESYGALAPLVFMGLLVAGLFVPGPELLIIGIGGAIFGAVRRRRFDR